MSFDQYTQFLCEKGHYCEYDSVEFLYPEDKETWKCPFCNSGLAWFNRVDLGNLSKIDPIYLENTNSDSTGHIEVRQKTLEITETCKECGHVKIVEEATYFVPEGGKRL